jgi:hypothetical protein
MAENEGAREAVLSRLRTRLDRLADLVGGGASVAPRPESRISMLPAVRSSSGLEGVLRARERNGRPMAVQAGRRASA